MLPSVEISWSFSSGMESNEYITGLEKGKVSARASIGRTLTFGDVVSEYRSLTTYIFKKFQHLQVNYQSIIEPALCQPINC